MLANNEKTSRSGFTLMEVLLVTALLAVLTAASFSIIYWQMRIQSHVTQNALFMNRIVNTQVVMRKVLRSISPASLTVDVDKIVYSPAAAAAPVTMFACADGALTFNGNIFCEGMVASFAKLVASGAPDIDTGNMPLSEDCTNLIGIRLFTTGREKRNLEFLVRPRGK